MLLFESWKWNVVTIIHWFYSDRIFLHHHHHTDYTDSVDSLTTFIPVDYHSWQAL